MSWWVCTSVFTVKVLFIVCNYYVPLYVQPWNHLSKEICKKTSAQPTQHPKVSCEWQGYLEKQMNLYFGKFF